MTTKRIFDFLRNERGAVRGGLLTALLLAVLAVSVPTIVLPSAQADGGDFQLDFIAAAPDDYDHTTSPAVELVLNGLQFDQRAINDNVVEQLEAEDFACLDTIVFFTEVTVDSDAIGTQSIDLHYEFDAINNGQKAVGYREVVAVGLSAIDFAGQNAETGNVLSGNETVSLMSEAYSPSGSAPPAGFGTNDAQLLLLTVRVTGLEASEVAIVRVDARFACFGSDPTGNLHAAMGSAEVVAGGRGTVNVGRQDIPMLGLGKLVIDTPTPTPSPTPTDTPTPTPTDTPTPTPTDTPTPTPTDTPTSEATPTSVAPTATSTPFTEVLGFPVTGNGGPTSGSLLLSLLALAGLGTGLLALGYWQLKSQSARGR